jgi:hypothetical protein
MRVRTSRAQSADRPQLRVPQLQRLNSLWNKPEISQRTVRSQRVDRPQFILEEQAETAMFLVQFIKRPADRPRPSSGPSADQTTSLTREHFFWNEES